MPIVSSDIKFYHSTGKLGGAKTTTQVQSGVKHDLFDKFTAAEALAGGTYYTAIFLQNTHATLTAEAVKLYIASQTPSADTLVEIGLAPEGVNSAVQAIVDENTAPTGVTFSTPADLANGIAIPNLAANDYLGVWIKLTLNANTAAAANDGFTLDTYLEYTE